MRVFAGFNEQGICKQVVIVNDDTMAIDPSLEEITNEDEKVMIKVNKCKKVNGVLVLMTEEEVTALHMNDNVIVVSVVKTT